MRWLTLLAILLACGSSSLAQVVQVRIKPASRQDKINELCAAGDWETAEAYALAEIESLNSLIAGNPDFKNSYNWPKDELAQVLTQLATSHNAQGKWEDAKAAAERALFSADFRITDNNLWPRRHHASERKAYAFQQKGIALFGLKDYDASQQAFEEALTWASEHRPKQQGEYRRVALDANHEDTAAILVHLADALLAQGKKAEAKPHLQRAVVIFEEKLGPDHKRTNQARAKLDDLKKHKRPVAVMPE